MLGALSGCVPVTESTHVSLWDPVTSLETAPRGQGYPTLLFESSLYFYFDRFIIFTLTATRHRTSTMEEAWRKRLWRKVSPSFSTMASVWEKMRLQPVSRRSRRFSSGLKIRSSLTFMQVLYCLSMKVHLSQLLWKQTIELWWGGFSPKDPCRMRTSWSAITISTCSAPQPTGPQ